MFSVSAVKIEYRQFRVLVRHFFQRFFQNDIVSLEIQMKEKLIAGLAVLAVLCGFFAYSILAKYLISPDTGSSWVDKTIYIYFLMIIMGFITVLEWDVIFPDKRDYLNIAPLPVRNLTLFAAKLTSLLLFAGLIAVAINLPAALVFVFYLSGLDASNLLAAFHFFGVHLFSCIAACMAIFFTAIFLIGILMLVCGSRLFRRISIYIRMLLMIAFFLQMTLFLAGSNPLLGTLVSWESLHVLKSENSLFFHLFPPFWFTGLYEKLLGNTDPFFAPWAGYAGWSLVLPLLGFFICGLLTYRKNISESTLNIYGKYSSSGDANIFRRVFNAVFLRNPVERAVFYFFKKTLARSKLHKMQLLTYIAVAAGLVFIMLAYLSGIQHDFAEPNKTLLAIPLLLTLLLVFGIQNTIVIPFTLEAHWVFKFTESNAIKPYLLGLKKGVMWLILMPLFLLCFLFYLYFWNWSLALLHCLFSFFIALLLQEAVLWNYRKIPFACSYLPGKTKMQFYFVVYFIGVMTYGSLLSLLALQLIQVRTLYFYTFCAALLILSGIKIYRERKIYPDKRIIYEENPEPIVIGFHSES